MRKLPVPEVGQQFTRLTVISAEVKSVGSRRAVMCRCECGAMRDVAIADLLSGHVKSCGKCNRGAQFATWINSPENAERLRRLHADPAFRARRAEIDHSPEYRAKQSEAKTSHGMSRHPLYGTWRNMMTRCMDPQSRDYERYGGRGIKVCDRWLDVRLFIEDIERNLGSRPTGCSLDRIDNDRGYEPTNVQWATGVVQAANRRKAAWLCNHHWRTILAALLESSSPETLDAHAALTAQLKTFSQGELTKQDVRDVIAVYIKAWETQDENLILTIFTEDATYHERVMHDPIPDRDSIGAYWRSKVVEAQANITCQLVNVWLDGDTAICEWEAEFDDLAQGVRKRMKEIAVLEFVPVHASTSLGFEWRIASLREYWSSSTVGQAALSS